MTDAGRAMDVLAETLRDTDAWTCNESYLQDLLNEAAEALERAWREAEANRRDSGRLQWLIDHDARVIECTTQRKGFRSTMTDAPREVWDEFDGWIVSTMSAHTKPFKTQREAIDAAIVQEGK